MLHCSWRPRSPPPSRDRHGIRGGRHRDAARDPTHDLHDPGPMRVPGERRRVEGRSHVLRRLDRRRHGVQGQHRRHRRRRLPARRSRRPHVRRRGQGRRAVPAAGRRRDGPAVRLRPPHGGVHQEVRRPADRRADVRQRRRDRPERRPLRQRLAAADGVQDRRRRRRHAERRPGRARALDRPDVDLRARLQPQRDRGDVARPLPARDPVGDRASFGGSRSPTRRSSRSTSAA